MIMGNAKHTAGPWSVEGFGIKAIVRAANGVIVAIRHRLGAGEHEANSSLIAAAPELLEALNQIIWKLERKEVVGSKFDGGVRCEFAKIDRNDAVIGLARSAIAKATGGQ